MASWWTINDTVTHSPKMSCHRSETAKVGAIKEIERRTTTVETLQQFVDIYFHWQDEL